MSSAVSLLQRRSGNTSKRIFTITLNQKQSGFLLLAVSCKHTAEPLGRCVRVCRFHCLQARQAPPPQGVFTSGGERSSSCQP